VNSEELNQTLKYIEESEKNLSQYTDKLRSEVSKFFNIFGDKAFCRICQDYENKHNITKHQFQPKIEVSIDFEGEPFYRTYGKVYRLAIRHHQLVIVMNTEYSEGSYGVYEVQRSTLHALLKSGAITKFFQELAEELKKQSEEYREVSAIAEKLANAVA